ncbi:MAG: polysaccharide deacetylase family protein [Burkholderiales bacterium]|nr:polysaccharide deacetylase family protein [Pseudomonadota bacterium]MCC7067455.1 polysaccharide deacetylase family protein [Burkholderiales bacterium]
MRLPFVARRFANRALDACFLAPLDRLFANRFRGRVVCLLYHRVAEPGAEPVLDAFGTPPIPPRELERELRLLAAWGGRFMTLDELAQGAWPSPREVGLIVSFDDGFRDTYEAGLPVVEALGARALVFQISAMLTEAPALLWEHALYWLGAEDARFRALARSLDGEFAHLAGADARATVTALRERANASQLRAMVTTALARCGEREALADLARRWYPQRSTLDSARRNGHEIGSHGAHHFKRSALDAAAFEAELVASKQALAEACGIVPRAFSYPFNSHGVGDEAIAARHFEWVFTVDGGPLAPSFARSSVPRFTWPGPHPNALRRRRWLRTGYV